jgi:rare lipoprotein A
VQHERYARKELFIASGRKFAVSALMSDSPVMKHVIICATFIMLADAIQASAADTTLAASGQASWYGEDHRGRLMANGKPFNPDRLTAASWFYPLGSKVMVTARTSRGLSKQVLVTITDRGPAKDLVRDGRIIDLTHAAFRRLADPDLGLVDVRVQPWSRRNAGPQVTVDDRSGARKARVKESARDRVG